LNLGLVYFARGEYGNAKREFETTTNTEYGERSSITFGALNTLELVRSLCLDSWRGVCGGSERIAQLDGLKDLLISGTWQRVASESQLQVVTSHIDVLSIGVLWNGRLNAKPKPNELVFLWYLLDPVSNAWKVIPEISGPLQSERAEATNQEFTDYRSYLLAARPRDCLQQGDYRVEIFAGGKRTFTERFRREGYFDPKFLPESNLALCAPTGWGTQEKRGVVPLTFFGDRRGTGIMVGSAPFFEDTDADRLRLVALLNSSPKGEVRSRSDHCTSPTAPKPVLQRVLRAGHVQALVNAWTGRDKLGYFTVALSDGTNPDDLRECELMRSVEVMDSVEPSH
jgi:hypothetical protein